jgi:DNA helicase-2/ATP-dependent DNA helicase PcrA
MTSAWTRTPPFVPTQEQARVEQSTAPRILVEANAGVGKTTTLCLRALRMVGRGVDPARIVMLTYSEPGAEAIVRSFERLGAPATLRRRIRVGTFDDFCVARLARFEDRKLAVLRRPEDVRGFVLRAIAQAREDAERRHPGAFVLEGRGELAVEALLRDFERLKGTMSRHRGWDGRRASPSLAAELGLDYTTLAVHEAHERLRLVDVGADGEQVRFRYQGDPTHDLASLLVADDPAFSWETHPLRMSPLEAIFVDEFHDMNWAMAFVLRGLMEVHPQAGFAGVGDVDQVIHAASGAESSFLRDGFEREFGAVERLALTETQRFGRAIAEPLGRFACKPYAWRADRQSSLEALALDDSLELALHIQAVLLTRGGRPAGEATGGVAVLLRHPNAALDLEYQLLDRGIACEVAGFTAYTSRPEVLFVRMVLAAAVGCDDAFTAESFVAAKRATFEFIGGYLPLDGAADPDPFPKLDAMPFETFRSFAMGHFLDNTPRQAGAQCVRDAMAIAQGDEIGRFAQALAALQIRRHARHVFVQAEAVRDTEDSLAALDRIVQRNSFHATSEFLRIIRAQEERRRLAPAGDRVVLSTIARAKGLEFDHVIVPGVEAAAFDGDDEDERHLFYVAVSRARHVVQLVHRPGRASSFVPPHLGSD